MDKDQKVFAERGDMEPRWCYFLNDHQLVHRSVEMENFYSKSPTYKFSQIIQSGLVRRFIFGEYTQQDRGIPGPDLIHGRRQPPPGDLTNYRK